LGSNSLKKDDSHFNSFSEENSSSISNFMEFQKDTVNCINQNTNSAIGKIDNLVNFLENNQSNIVKSTQKITEAIQMNQDCAVENPSLRKEIIQYFAVLPTLLQDTTSKLGNRILDSFQRQLEAFKDCNDKTMQNSL
jgi:hypothetical protein